MATAPNGSIINHGLAFLGLLAFIVSFSGARIFTTLHPHMWVVIDGIHVHHFWYGLVMLAVAGWLGIISTHPLHRRLYALVFGLGVGLIGDEVGLLLTFGNYYSELTYVFAVSFIVVALLGLLLSSYKDRLKDDVTGIGTNERLVHIGVIIAGLSIAAFSVSAFLAGSIILVVGVAVAAAGTRGLLAREDSSAQRRGY
jgi:hypothetical protein